LHIAGAQQQTALSLFTHLQNGVTFLPGQHHEATLGEITDQLTRLADALKTSRAARNPRSAVSHKQNNLLPGRLLEQSVA
jgi:argininosuccinate lyase